MQFVFHLADAAMKDCTRLTCWNSVFYTLLCLNKLESLFLQAENDDTFLKQHYLDETNYIIRMKYEAAQR